MPSGNGGVKAKGRTLDNVSCIKKSIVTVKSRDNCLAHALIIAVAKLENDPNYKAYTNGWKIKTKVNELLATTKINLSNGGGLQELQKFSDHFQNYRIVVYSGLNSNDIMYDSGSVGKRAIYLFIIRRWKQTLKCNYKHHRIYGYRVRMQRMQSGL